MYKTVLVASWIASVSLSCCWAEPQAEAGLPYDLELQVYDGPNRSAGQSWDSGSAPLEPGSDAARRFLEAASSTNPGLANAYRTLTEPGAFQDAMRQLVTLRGTRPTVVLVDDRRKFVDADGNGQPDSDAAAQKEKGVWPHASGGKFYVSQSYFSTYGDDPRTIQSLLAHELTHTQDSTALHAGDYGPDDGHYINEILFNQGMLGGPSTNAAFIEGLADTIPLLIGADDRASMIRSTETLRAETTPGNYFFVPWRDVAYPGLMSVEGVNALILNDIATTLPDGRRKVTEAVRTTNYGGRTLETVLGALVRDNPEDALAITAIHDAYTGFRASDEEIVADLPQIEAERYLSYRDRLRNLNTDRTVWDASRISADAAERMTLPTLEAQVSRINNRLRLVRGGNTPSTGLFSAPGADLERSQEQARQLAELRSQGQALRQAIARASASRLAEGMPRSDEPLDEQLALPSPETLPRQDTDR